jgi:O-acetyl-ADP-ribose deacetylase (regulator of RNase III)
MIREVTGDLMLSGCQAIAHGVAPAEHFDRGLALDLREKYPSMARDFRHYVKQCHPHPGEIWTWGGFGGVRIFNLITQVGGHGEDDHPGPATEATVNHCLRRLRHELEKGEVKSLALPKLATGVGRLSWEKVRPLITANLGDLQIPIYIYTTYHPGMKAEEREA